MTGRLSLTEGKCSQMVDDGAAAAAALEAQRWGEAKRAALAEAQAVGEAALQQAASALVGYDLGFRSFHLRDSLFSVAVRVEARPTEQEGMLHPPNLICHGIAGSSPGASWGFM